MIDRTSFRISSTTNEPSGCPAPEPQDCSASPGKPNQRLNDVEKRLALFEELLFDCAMTLKDKVAERLDQLEDLCHQETAQLRQEWQENNQDRKKELNQLTLKISEAIDRIAAEKSRGPSNAGGQSDQPAVSPGTPAERLSDWDGPAPGRQTGNN